MKTSLLIAIIPGLLASCVRPDVETCGDLICPTHTACVVDEHRCIDIATVSVPLGDIELLDVPCGQPAEKILPLHNYGATPIAFRATAATPSVTVEPADGVVSAGESLELHVKANPGTVAGPGRVIVGTISVETDVASESRAVHTSAAGAVPLVQGSFNFGETALTVPKTKTLSLRNDGTTAVGITLGDFPQGSAFSRTSASTIMLGPGASGHFTAEFAPSALTDYHDTASLSFDGAVCETPPSEIAATGTASGEAILLGEAPVVFSPAVGCTQGGATHALELTSNLPADADVDLAFSDGADELHFFNVDPAVTIPSLGHVTVNIQRRSTKEVEVVGLHQAQLTLTAQTMNGPVTRTLMVEQNVQAPVLVVSPSVVALDPSSPIAGAIMVMNTGNASGDVRLEPPSALVNGQIVAISPATFKLLPGESRVLTFTVESRPARGPMPEPPTFRTHITAPGMCSLVPEIRATL